jgi:hypothetical protein
MTDKSDGDKLRQQRKDAQFLARNFDMSPDTASELVARQDVDAKDLGQSIKGRDGEVKRSDPLADTPTPSQPKTQYTADADEQARKPVLHHRNNRAGGG